MICSCREVHLEALITEWMFSNFNLMGNIFLIKGIALALDLQGWRLRTEDNLKVLREMHGVVLVRQVI